MTYEEKKTAFYDKMKEYTRQDICIAFSGGVDSSLLLMAAQKSMEENRKIYAVTFDTMLHPACDLENAKKVAEEAGVAHKILFLNELEQADTTLRRGILVVTDNLHLTDVDVEAMLKMAGRGDRIMLAGRSFCGLLKEKFGVLCTDDSFSPLEL